jgi:hypothetical protein
MESNQRYIFQIIYGVLLLLAGVGLFFRIPQVVESMESYRSSLQFFRICLYIIGCLLVGGGIKKIHINYKQLTGKNKNGETE